MVQAWYMKDEVNDQRLENHLSPPVFIDLDKLYEVTGVEYFKVRYTCLFIFG